MFEDGAARAAQSFAYEIREDSAVILRCFSRDTRAEIPEQIGGYPVTELGAYAFSAHFEEEKLSEALRAGRARLYVPESLKFGLESGLRWRGISQPSVPEPLKSGLEGAEQSGESGDGTMFRNAGNGMAPAFRDSLVGIALPPALCGTHLEEISLSPTVRRVGRYCFYNCANLRRIEFHGELSDWGSGVLTGCHGVKSLRVYTDADGRSHLKDVLDELREELEVEYFTGQRNAAWTEDRYAGDSEAGYADDPEAGVPARLIFPEFYEEGVENTPARILETHVHGSGILYRNCFQGRAFDFAQYDALFPHAKAWESGEVVLRMALWRLRVPQGLTRGAKEQYGSYLAEHAEEAGKWLLGQRDLDGVRFLLELVRTRQLRGKTALKTADSGETEGDAGETGEVSRGTLESALLAEASRIQYMEAVSFLMERLSANRTERPARRRRLEL